MVGKFIFLFLLGVLVVPVSSTAFADEEQDAVFKRVIETKTLRCGYWNWPPLYMVDPNTKETTGIFKDLMAEFTRVTDIQVEWTQEIHFDNLISDLNNKKIDAVCAGAWLSGARAKFIRFSNPVFYTTMNAYKRADDPRFDGNRDSMNQPDITIIGMDGEMSSEIAKADFPKAKLMSLPQIAGSATELLLNVDTGKGDITFADAVGAGGFIKNNPGKIASVKMETPIRLMSNTIAVAGDEERFQDFVNSVLQELHNSGVVEHILEKYDSAYPNVLVRVSKPYQE
ncbi:MAG: transporter substrate-binding domain-containing protein [Alphaproteobacteria bacterium]|nr:transporter substrate-binding domain-containing protein [Alphaproteobacteria bacterium]